MTLEGSDMAKITIELTDNQLALLTGSARTCANLLGPTVTGIELLEVATYAEDAANWIGIGE